MTKGIKSIIDYSGPNSLIVKVECHITNGLPSLIIIGHANRAVDEAKDRLRASFANSSLELPKKRITLNLSPADVPKDSTALDLAMALSILEASRQIDTTDLEETLFLGELSLEGLLNPVRGLVGKLLAAKAQGYKHFYIPAANLKQALLIPDINIKSALNLRDVYLDLAKIIPLKVIETSTANWDVGKMRSVEIDLSEISGQAVAKRALEIAAAGRHNILLHGPPGTGKTMLARAMCGILPALEHDEILEVTHLHSLGTSEIDKIISLRPFRSPHHTASTTALVGGGSNPKPGEASLAHRGVLFLDELPEFSRSCLEALRQPLEEGAVNISRVRDTVTYPADFILVATQNPCPCGFFGTNKTCNCSASAVERYRKKISGPILDRIDLHLSVGNIDHRKLLENPAVSETAKVRKRVEKAAAIQYQRFGAIRFNASMNNKEVRQLAKLSQAAKDLLDNAASKLDISPRAYMRTTKVARTIADLSESEGTLPEHISEALSYRYREL